MAVRCSWPTSSGSPAGSVRIRTTPASQASRRAVSAVIGPANGSSPPATPGAPRSAHSANQSMVTRTWAAAPRTVGQLAGPQRLAGQLDQGVAHPLAVGAQVVGRPIAVHHAPPARCAPSPRPPDPDARTDRSGRRALTAMRNTRGSPAASSRVPSGSMPATQRRTALAVSSGPERQRGLGEHRVGGGQVDAVGLGHRHPGRRHRRGHRRHVRRRDRAFGVGRRQPRQLRQPPPVPDQPGRVPAGDAGSARSARTSSRPCRRRAAPAAPHRRRRPGSAAPQTG